MNTEKKDAAEATPCKVLFSQLTIVVMTSEEAADVARLGSDINSLAPPTTKGQGIALALCRWWFVVMSPALRRKKEKHSPSKDEKQRRAAAKTPEAWVTNPLRSTRTSKSELFRYDGTVRICFLL